MTRRRAKGGSIPRRPEPRSCTTLWTVMMLGRLHACGCTEGGLWLRGELVFIQNPSWQAMMLASTAHTVGPAPAHREGHSPHETMPRLAWLRIAPFVWMSSSAPPLCACHSVANRVSGKREESRRLGFNVVQRCRSDGAAAWSVVPSPNQNGSR